MVNNKHREKQTQSKIKQIRREEEEKRAKDLAQELGFSYIDLRTTPINNDALTLITEEESREGKGTIIGKRQKELQVVVLNPKSEETKKFIKNLEQKGYSPNILIVSKSNLEKAWDRYKDIKAKKKITKTTEIDISELEKIQKEIETVKDLEEKLTQPDLSATQILNTLMAASIKLESSDVHLENEAEKTTRIRFRIDGILKDICDIPNPAYELLLSRIKILSELKLNITDQAQDGRFSFESGGLKIEVRVSIIPAEYGENVVMRILDPKTIGLKLEDLGIQNYDFETIKKELKRPNGMIVTTGPTGSGKTTLLYAFLKKVNRPEIKIITLENPIEYHLEGIEQTQVNADENYTFAKGLRSILRQDPDMILVGEVRDNETAETAINAALTGHLVFSTLHTNDAAGAVPRLVDMKVNPSLIPPALNLVIAQRLVRKVCPKCSKDIKPKGEILERIKGGLKNLPARIMNNSTNTENGIADLVKKLKSGKITIKQTNPEGCEYCNFTGYKGRIGVFELFIIDDAMEKTILKTPSIANIRETAVKAGMTTMQQDGLLKVLQGTTTMDEVERVLGV